MAKKPTKPDWTLVWRAVSFTESSNITTVDLKTLLLTTGKASTSRTLNTATSSSRRPRTVENADPNEKLKTFASTRNKNGTTSSVTLPASFKSSETVRKLRLEELKTTRVSHNITIQSGSLSHFRILFPRSRLLSRAHWRLPCRKQWFREHVSTNTHTAESSLRSAPTRRSRKSWHPTVLWRVIGVMT